MSKNETEALVRQDDEPGRITRLAAEYERQFVLRAAVQAIPMIGGPLDTLFAGMGARWQIKRVESFLQLLSSRLAELEQKESTNALLAPSEQLYDFIREVLEHVTRARSEVRRERFANIVARQVAESRNWDDAEAASRLVAEFTDLEIHVLLAIAQAPLCGDPFGGMRIATIVLDARWGHFTEPRPRELASVFPEEPKHALELSVSSLLARGLLSDEGASKYDVKAKEFVRVSDLGTWFLEWIRRNPAPDARAS